MPWGSGAEFAHRHNKKLEGAAADKAKDIANAILREHPDQEGMAIAVANKYGNKVQRKQKRRPMRDDGDHEYRGDSWGSLDGS